MRISVLGLGYIGLPTALMFADAGHDVSGFDINPAVVNALSEGRSHIEEPGLQEMLGRVLATGQFRCSSELESAEAFIICVPTPFKEDKVPDLSYVEAATKTVATVAKRGDLVVLESTCPVGTTEEVVSILLADAGCQDLLVAHCPETVLPGNMIHELAHNERVVGGVTKEATHAAVELYRSIVQANVHTTDAKSAEMAKLVQNAFRDVNIAFANEVALISEALNVDPWHVIDLANMHPRVSILRPGIGVGGHCISVDPWFIAASAPDEATLIRAARQVNEARPSWAVDKILREAPSHPGPILLLGLTYKPDVGDFRESPALKIVAAVASKSTRPVWVADPFLSYGAPELGDLNVRAISTEELFTTKPGLTVILVRHRAYESLLDERKLAGPVMDLTGPKTL